MVSFFLYKLFEADYCSLLCYIMLLYLKYYIYIFCMPFHLYFHWDFFFHKHIGSGRPPTSPPTAQRGQWISRLKLDPLCSLYQRGCCIPIIIHSPSVLLLDKILPPHMMQARFCPPTLSSTLSFNFHTNMHIMNPIKIISRKLPEAYIKSESMMINDK